MSDHMTFCLAGQALLPAAEDIYNLCFSSPLEAHYVLRRSGYCRTYLAFWDARPAATISVLPGGLRVGERDIAAVYLYGVATHPAFQGRGIAASLLRYVHSELEREGVALSLLYPSTPKNRTYYAARGFENISVRCEGHFMGREESSLRALSVGASDYARERRNRCPDGSFLWGEDGLRFQENWLRLFGGGFYLLQKGERVVGCAACTFETGVAVIRELLMEPGDPRQAAAAMRRVFNANQAVCYLDRESGERAGLPPEPFAMVHRIGSSPICLPDELYFNLALD